MFLSLYVHYPFCTRKCPYCDYNSHVRAHVDHEAWEAAYLKTLDDTAQRIAPRPLGSIFFGGGTPSLMPPRMVAAVIAKAEALFGLQPDCEITLEANPSVLSREQLTAFRSAGVNRLSLGVQALIDKDLHALGRDHSSAQARQAMEWAEAIFDRWSFDLMFGREGQTVAAWEAELREALGYNARHLSLYQLTLEPNTTFYTRAQHGRLRLPSHDAQADMYDTTLALCAEQGLQRYEISSFAVPSQECRHNLNYWVYGDYMGIGAGAHGRLTTAAGKVATTHSAMPEKWLAHVSEGSLDYAQYHNIPRETQVEEALILGLRTTRGLPLERFIAIAGQSPEAYFGERLARLVKDGLLTYDTTHLKATANGLAFLNTIETQLFT